METALTLTGLLASGFGIAYLSLGTGGEASLSLRAYRVRRWMRRLFVVSALATIALGLAAWLR